VRHGDRARIVRARSGLRASIRAIDACCVALRRASQPASASPTGPAPTMARSYSGVAGEEAVVIGVRETG
jgi:hypothetical protein